ncbi:MAG: hypothetical protein Ctma_0486 [Catillopecten margaritatus gill symbiont]|uniref:DUF4115 domain-containing protein n=1 Tax=Catillopecten margaritatus gill symbiont TaxID=3083288 RepID=A0AAU6PFK3_9GAMM
MNRKQLTLLNIIVPLSKKVKKQVWRNISSELDLGFTGQVSQLRKYWGYILSGVTSLGLLLSVTLINQTVHAQLDWDINTDLSKQQISVVATTHQHVNEKNACTLWIKKGDKMLLVGAMPETGKKTFNLNSEVLSMLKKGTIIISFENKDNPLPSTPTLISYQGEWTF